MEELSEFQWGHFFSEMDREAMRKYIAVVSENVSMGPLLLRNG